MAMWDFTKPNTQQGGVNEGFAKPSPTAKAKVYDFTVPYGATAAVPAVAKRGLLARLGAPTEVEKKIQLAQSFRTTVPPQSGVTTIGRSLTAGVGDVISNVGAVAGWVGGKAGLEQPGVTTDEAAKKVQLAQSFRTKTPIELPAAGAKLQEYGGKVAAKYAEEPVAWQGWKTLLNPRFYAVNVARTVPTSASLVIPAAVAGGAVAGLGTFAGAAVAGSLNRAMESAMEAGGTYQDALTKGMSKEEADKAANSTFRNNMKLVGLDIAEFMTAFFPGIKAATKVGKAAVAAGRLALAGAEEAYEEGLQEKYQREALGEKFTWGAPQTQEAMAIGGLMGIGLGGAGEVSSYVTEIQKATAGKLSEVQRFAFNKDIVGRMAQGRTWQQASQEALATLAKDPATQPIVSQATQQVMAKYPAKQKTPFQAQAQQIAPLEAPKVTVGRQVRVSGSPETYTIVNKVAGRYQLRDESGGYRVVEAYQMLPIGAQAGTAVTPQAAPPSVALQPREVATPSLPSSVAPIAAPGVSGGVPAAQGGRFPGAGRVAVVEPKPAGKPGTIQDITAELKAKQAKMEGLPAAQEAWTGRTPDVLKQAVQRIEQQQGSMAKAVKAKFGEEGFVERQVTGVANLFAEMRAKDDVKVADADVEKVLSATKSAKTVAAQIVNKMRDIGNAFKDVFSYEWRLKEYPRFQDQVRRFQGAQRDAQVSALETYLAIVSPMDDKALGPGRFKLFERLIDLRDMLEDKRAGKLVSGDLTEEQLVAAESELMAKADETVIQSLKNHDDLMKAAWQELQRRGKVSQEAEGREHYYPHRILDYMREIDAKYPALARKLKAPYRYYLKKRGGTTRMFDTDYLTVTMNHLTKLYLDNATDDFALEVARDYDAWPKLSDAERQRYGGTPEAGRLYEIDGERYFGWSYDTFHRTKNPILTEITDPMLVQADLEARKQMQKFLSQVHVIPEAVADRIAQLKQPGINSHILGLVRASQWIWKNIVLGPFGAGIPFQINNFIGDTMNHYREDPRTILFIPQGWRVAGEWQKGQISEEFLHVMDVAEQTRVMEAGLMRAGGIPYDPVLSRLQPIRYALKKLNPFEGWRKLGERRELSGKLAKLMADLERIGKGEMPLVKMWDAKKLVEAGTTPVEVAGKVAREAAVDYGKLTPEGKTVVRDLFFPFSTFYVQNFQNWVTYIQRNPGEMALKFLLPMVALAAYNALRFPEEEEGLPIYYRMTPHLITGYKTPDGKPIIISFQTPLDQAARFLGLEIVGDLARQVATGKKDMDDAAKELAGNMALAMPRQMWNLFNVFFKAPIEAAMNKNTFTGAPIVPDDIKDTPEGIKGRLSYMVQQWFSPYGAYVRAAKDLEPEKALGEWLKQGPVDIKRAFGIREVDLEKEQVGRFYDEVDRLEGAYAVWKDKRDKGKQPGAFADLARLRRLQAVARDFTDQWKIIDRIKADKTRTQAQKDKEVRDRYQSMARRVQSVLNPGK